MTITGENERGQSFLQRASQAWRYGRHLLTLGQYHVGDIQSEQGVLVLSGAAVVGDIKAPKIVVAGLAYGLLVAQEVTIEAGGQVWGDVYAASFHLAPGGKVHGWVSSLDEAIAAVMNGEIVLGEGGNGYVPNFPLELEEAGLDVSALQSEEAQEADRERLAVWRQLQAEAAAAVLARAELEKSFGDRIDEVAGESLAEAARLREEVSTFREERDALQRQIDKLEEQLSYRDSEAKIQAEELAAVRGSMGKNQSALEELQKVFEQQSLKAASLENARRQLEQQLVRKSDQAEEMVKRVENLESALQGSLQHTAEQEEALIRWQELAEVTEKKANALESELEAMKLQFKESTQVVEMLRTQREKLEKEWERANADLMDVTQQRARLQAELDRKSSQLTELEKESGKLRDSLQILQHRFETQPPEYESALSKLEMAEANMADLKEKLAWTERESQDHYEQLLWTKASLDTTCSELDDLRLVAGQYDEAIAQLQGKLAEKEAQADKWKESVGRMTDLLYAAERKVKEMEENVVQSQKQAQDDSKKEEMRKRIREQQLQIEAYEGEINYFHTEIDRQSHQLADMQATLIEREVSLGQTREIAQKQAAQLEQIKKLAGSRIRQLEKELAETQQKLKDLSVWLERRRRRGESLEPPKT